MREPTIEELEEQELQYKRNQEFRDELIALINRYNLENLPNTPDFIIADMMINSYLSLVDACQERDKWYGVHLEPGNKYFKETSSENDRR